MTAKVRVTRPLVQTADDNLNVTSARAGPKTYLLPSEFESLGNCERVPLRRRRLFARPPQESDSA